MVSIFFIINFANFQYFDKICAIIENRDAFEELFIMEILF